MGFGSFSCASKSPLDTLTRKPYEGGSAGPIPYLTFPRMGVARMSPTRRDFLKLTTIGGAAAAVFGFDLKPAFAQLRTLKIARASETRSTCPYCAVGCGTIIYTIADRAKNVTAQVVHVEGDPDHPPNPAPHSPTPSPLHQHIIT